MTDITQILNNIEQGDPLAAEQLLPLVYDDLRKLAARELRREPAGNTLQPTALVHEAYLRLVKYDSEPQWNHRGHFFGAAAKAMRRILVECARSRKALKRGGNRQRVPIDEGQLQAIETHPDILALDEALTKLESERPDLAQLVSLRYFAGLTMKQAAEALDTSLRTTERNWSYVRAWLLDILKAQN